MAYKNKAREKLMERKKDIRNRTELRKKYVKRQLVVINGFLNDDITDEAIYLKRTQLQLHRTIEQFKRAMLMRLKIDKSIKNKEKILIPEVSNLDVKSDTFLTELMNSTLVKIASGEGDTDDLIKRYRVILDTAENRNKEFNIKINRINALIQAVKLAQETDNVQILSLIGA